MATKRAAKKTKKKAPAPKKKKSVAAKKKPAHPSVVHWEVQARDPARQQQFFSELFGWQVDANNPMNYGMVSASGKGSIGGGIGRTEDAPRATVYVQGPGLNAALTPA